MKHTPGKHDRCGGEYELNGVRFTCDCHNVITYHVDEFPIYTHAPELLEACRQADIVLNQRNVYLPKDKKITKEQAINSLCQAITNAEKL